MALKIIKKQELRSSDPKLADKGRVSSGAEVQFAPRPSDQPPSDPAIRLEQLIALDRAAYD